MISVALVSCGALKLTRRAPARELYISALFRASLAHALARADHVFIVSAMHGLVELQEELDPYQLNLKQLAPGQRARWGQAILERLRGAAGSQPLELMLLAGAEYARHLQPQDAWGWSLIEPMAGLQIGQRLSWLKQQREATTALRQALQQLEELLQEVGDRAEMKTRVEALITIQRRLIREAGPGAPAAPAPAARPARAQRERRPDDTRCTAAHPMPRTVPASEESRWTHAQIDRVYEGSLYDELACPHCGRTWKAAKKR